MGLAVEVGLALPFFADLSLSRVRKQSARQSRTGIKQVSNKKGAIPLVETAPQF
jgi:hypothetical protein